MITNIYRPLHVESIEVIKFEVYNPMSFFKPVLVISLESINPPYDEETVYTYLQLIIDVKSNMNVAV